MHSIKKMITAVAVGAICVSGCASKPVPPAVVQEETVTDNVAPADDPVSEQKNEMTRSDLYPTVVNEAVEEYFVSGTDFTGFHYGQISLTDELNDSKWDEPKVIIYDVVDKYHRNVEAIIGDNDNAVLVDDDDPCRRKMLICSLYVPEEIINIELLARDEIKMGFDVCAQINLERYKGKPGSYGYMLPMKRFSNEDLFFIVTYKDGSKENIKINLTKDFLSFRLE